MAYTGIYERTIFYNPVNKYSVISVKTSDRSIPEKARSAYRHRDNMIHLPPWAMSCRAPIRSA